MKPALRLTLLHELPGRMRVLLSHPLRNPEGFVAALRAHDGVLPVRYSPRVRTLLATFDPASIEREELLVRMALGLSIENGFRPVRIQKKTASDALTSFEALSAATLLAAALARALMRAGTRTAHQMEGLAAALTGGAVLLHGRRELQRAGVFHPELLSLIVLATGWRQGRPLQAASLTWVAAFGRHLKEPAEPAVEIRPLRTNGRRDVVVTAVPDSPGQALLRILPTLIRSIQQTGRPLDGLLSNLREMSRHHDHVLDALGPWKQGIPVRFPEWTNEPLN